MKAVSDRNVPRRGVLWFGTITLGLITGFMAPFFSQSGWTPPAMAFEAICAAATIGLTLTLVSAARFWWGMRIVTFLMSRFSSGAWLTRRSSTGRWLEAIDCPPSTPFVRSCLSDYPACSTHYGAVRGASWASRGRRTRLGLT